MKNILKLIAVGALCVPIGSPAWGLNTEGPVGFNCCFWPSQGTCTGGYSPLCTDRSFCSSCSGTGTQINSYGIAVTGRRSIQMECVSNIVTPTCEVTNVTSYECAVGYYGTATSQTSGCTRCPANATCSGGNGSTFVCKAGYQKNDAGTGCEKMPPLVLSCPAGQYMDTSQLLKTCRDCPSPGTSASGSTGITSCYIPSGYTGSDGTGSYKYAANCYYKE